MRGLAILCYIGALVTMCCGLGLASFVLLVVGVWADSKRR